MSNGGRGAAGGVTFLPAGPRDEGDWKEIEATSRSSSLTIDMLGEGCGPEGWGVWVVFIVQ
jgi:hypothetical protein